MTLTDNCKKSSSNLNNSNSDKKKKVENVLDDNGYHHEDDQLKLLFESCGIGDIELVRELVDTKISVDRADEDDVTSLQVASAHGQDDMVKLLIMKGAALEKSNVKRWTPLMQGARQGHSSVVFTLLQNHADVNSRTKLGANAMLLASRKGDLSTCRMLNGAGIDPPGQQSGDPCNPSCDLTPLMVASFCGHYPLVKHFIECGDDVNQRSPSLGVSCLMMAALGGHEMIVKLLVEHGANPDKTDINSRTALDFASVRNHRKVQNFLSRITTFKSKTAYEDTKLDIIEATKKGNFLRVKEILDKDISQRDATLPDDGATALMFAAVSGRLDIVQELVEKGCDVDKQDHISGWTALMQAVYHGKKAVAKYLISVGTNVHINAKNGCNAFDMLTLLDDVDTELYRMLAAATIGSPESSKNSTLKKDQQSDLGLLSATFGSRSHSRQNLRDWWLKMSDRFKHLRWGSTFGLSSNIKNKNNNNNVSSCVTPGNMHGRKSLPCGTLSLVVLADKNGMEKVSSMSTINTLGAIKETESPLSAASIDDDPDPFRDSFVYTLGNLSAPIGSTLKTDLPLFLPPPTSHCHPSAMMPILRKNNQKKCTETGQSRPRNGTTQSFLPSLTRSRRKSGVAMAADLGNHIVATFSSKGTINNVIKNHIFTRQTTTTSITTNSSVSPSASSGSDELRKGMTMMTSLAPVNHPHPQLVMLHCSDRSKVNSSASSSTGTLTAGSEGHDKTPDMKKPASLMENELSLANLNIGPGFYLPMRYLDSNSSNQSKPSAYTGQSTSSNFMASADDLSSILQKLSLEKYQSIFEEQEVDMETFLVLTDSNLKELGIAHTESRKQLLSVIDRINHSKK